MSNQEKNNFEHEEIQSMLPWFVNQSLDGRDREIVSSHINDCEECQHEIQFLGSLNVAVQSDAQDNYEMHSNVDKSLASVMGRVDAEKPRLDATLVAPSSLLQKLGDMVTSILAPPAAQWGATALAGLLVAVLGFQMFSGQTEDNYTVLSSPDIASSSIRISVELVPDENWVQTQAIIQDEFHKLDQQVEFESASDGSYVLVIGDSIGVSELGKIVVNLENMEEINHVKLIP